MLTIRLIAVGNIKEKYFVDAIAEYEKRLHKYCKFEIIEVKESNKSDLGTNIKAETEAIKSRLKGYNVLCALNSKQVSSEDLAALFEKVSLTNSTVSFIIGGSHGVGAELDDFINEKISFGSCTFPHQLFRVTLVEQIYRAFTIIKGESYHK